MAATKDWSVQTAPGPFRGPSNVQYFADGHATDYCVHTPPTWAWGVWVVNRGAGLGWATVKGRGTPLSGVATARATTDGLQRIAAGGEWFIDLMDEAGSGVQFSTFGEDGAAHAWLFRFEPRRHGAY